MMSRTFRIVLAATLVAFVSAPAFAQVAVRMKNVGAQSVRVNAKTGAVGPAGMQSGSRVLAANGVAQFKVKPGTFTALAAKPVAPGPASRKLRQFSTRKFKTVYLEAQQDGATATLIGAPAGVKF
jgi:hypothetical protein